MKVVGVIALMFVAAVTGAWAWFHVAPPVPGERLRLQLVTTVPGWEFREELLGAEVRSILATTNLLNGSLFDGRGGRVTVFAADWDATDRMSMAVVQHTPDVCWVSAGWIPVNLGQPNRVTVPIGPRRTEFECQVFTAPGSGQRELVVWCTLVGGQVLAEGWRWAGESDSSSALSGRLAMTGRRMAASQFAANVSLRRRSTMDKQFVRISVPVGESVEAALEFIRTMTSDLLEVHAIRGGELR